MDWHYNYLSHSPIPSLATLSRNPLFQHSSKFCPSTEFFHVSSGILCSWWSFFCFSCWTLFQQAQKLEETRRKLHSFCRRKQKYWKVWASFKHQRRFFWVIKMCVSSMQRWILFNRAELICVPLHLNIPMSCYCTPTLITLSYARQSGASAIQPVSFFAPSAISFRKSDEICPRNPFYTLNAP